MTEDEIKTMLDNTILDWNRPSQLTDISADANYRKLIPAINAYTTNKIIEELATLSKVFSPSVRDSDLIVNRIAELKALNHRKET